jgi:hypothetical protein
MAGSSFGAGDVAKAVGQGMQTYGNLEAVRKGGGSIGGMNPSRETDKDQEKIDKAVTETQRALRPRMGGQTEGQKALESGKMAIPGARKGGRIKATGIFRLHKGEVVVPADKVKRMEKRKAARKSGRR